MTHNGRISYIPSSGNHVLIVVHAMTNDAKGFGTPHLLNPNAGDPIAAIQ